MNLNRSNSFIQRQNDVLRQSETQALANYIGNQMVPNGSRVFIVSGTTACATAEVLLKKIRDLHIMTNSVPVAWRFMQMVEDGKEAPHVTVSITGGDVRAVTGAIAGKTKTETDSSATLIFAPHGLTEKGIVGNRDVDQIKKLVDVHRQVIMPVSWTKLGRPGSEAIKHWGHWKQVSCQLVLTDKPPLSLNISNEQRDKGEQLLLHAQNIMGANLKVHRVATS